MELYLYQGTELYEDKNFVVDNGSGSTAIENYLGTITGTNVKHFDNAQYLKDTGLDTEIKIALDQSYLEFSLNSNWNYCKIKNTEGWRYYFVRDIQWISKGCLKLVLHCDVLNTYQGKYSLDKRTTVVREHKDRYEDLGAAYSYTEHIDRGNFTIPLAPGTYPYVYEYEEQFDIPSGRTVTGTFHVTPSLAVQPDLKLVTFADGKVTIHLEYQSSIAANAWQGVDFTINVSASSARVIKRKIDKVPEGLNPVLFNRNEELLTGDSLTKENWYLVFASYGGEEKKIGSYLTKDSDFKAYVSNSTKKIINYSDLTANTYYYVDFATHSIDNPKGDGTGTCNHVEAYTVKQEEGVDVADKYIDTATVTGYLTDEHPGWSTLVDILTAGIYGMLSDIYTACTIKFWRDGTNIKMQPLYYWKWDNREGKGGWKYLSTSEGKITTIGDKLILTSNTDYKIYATSTEQKARKEIRKTISENVTVTPASHDIFGLNTINRTHKEYKKIIQLPYCPVNYEIITKSGVDYYNFKADDIEAGEIVEGETLIKLNKDIITRALSLTGTNYIKNVTDRVTISAVTSQLRNDANESKIYNSEFYLPKVSYDNFSKDFRLELIDNEFTADNTLNIGFNVARTLGSSMLFTFNDYRCDLREQDYNNILYVNRNNQVALYSNDYLDYLRDGYNYDVKSKNLNMIRGAVSTGVNTVQGAVNGFQQGGWAGALVGGVKNAAMGTYNTSMAAYDAQRSIDYRTAQLAHQGTNVRDCDDLDIFNAYSGNKLKNILYTPRDEVKQQILDLFYYCGYNCGYQGVPNTTSRKWFNFIQCEPVFSNVTFRMSADLKNELINKYNQGVTVIHKVNNNYDFAQVKENWETWLLN